MKILMLAIVAFTLCACHSKKCATSDSSTLMNDTTHVLAVNNSVLTNTSIYDFMAKCDSASVYIIADSITTPKGTIFSPSVVVAISAPSVSAVLRDSISAATKNVVDSVHYTTSYAAVNEQTQSETVAITKPPDFTLLIIIAIVLLLGLWFLRYRK